MDLDRFDRPVPITTESAESRLFARVYALMGMGLGLTAIVAWFTASSPAVLQVAVGNRLVFFGLMIGELGLAARRSGRVCQVSASAGSAALPFSPARPRL